MSGLWIWLGAALLYLCFRAWYDNWRRPPLRGFLPVLIPHAGHPAIHAGKIGGYLDAWNVEPDPGWTLTGYIATGVGAT